MVATIRIDLALLQKLHKEAQVPMPDNPSLDQARKWHAAQRAVDEAFSACRGDMLAAAHNYKEMKRLLSLWAQDQLSDYECLTSMRRVGVKP